MQATPQVPLHVGLRSSVGAGHTAHEVPQAAGELVGAHEPLQRWKFAAHAVTHALAAQLTVPLGLPGHGVQLEVQAVTSVSDAQLLNCPPAVEHAWKPRLQLY
jgi:hypothetical protein